MDASEKRSLTAINKIEEFSEVIRKLTTNEELDFEEKAYLLSCAKIFIRYYEEDKRKTSFIEFAFYLILKYSITYNDVVPLYDFSLNFGFYPIAKEILSKNLLEEKSIESSILEVRLENYRHNNYYETIEQYDIRKRIIENKESRSISYVAPTSFGKSTVIIEHIISNSFKKVAIIVPTKSLLIQTYRAIKKAELNRKLILHDEMYNYEDRFVAILTQERALRLMDKYNLTFDILYIDEAHNLYEKDPRNILLSRLIRRNHLNNPSLRIIYLSPLISNSQNLKIENQGDILEQRIWHNIKEPEIYEYTLDGGKYIYNRFVNQFYKIGAYSDFIEYIYKNKGKKNYVYLTSPRKIEEFSNEFSESLEYIQQDLELAELIEDIRDFVHQDFYIINLLRKGIIYLHGKIPDIVKEYLEFKFKDIKALEFIVANIVILEGINLPIDALFILNTYSLQEKELTNLIGRVNRLDQIFKDDKQSTSLNKLLPQIHFVNDEYYGRKQSNMRNKIEKLRSNIFNDEVNNPILKSFDVKNIKDTNEREKVEVIINSEDFLFTVNNGKFDELKKYLINIGLHNTYNISDEMLQTFSGNINDIQTSTEDWSDLDIVEKIYFVFIQNLLEFIIDFEIKRLSNEKARNYYKLHMFNNRTKSLKENVESTFQYFKGKISDKDSIFYFGQQYGDISYTSEVYDNTNLQRKVYVDLSQKTDSEIINLSIVKLKIEDDFVSFKLNRMINALYDLNMISEEEYNKVIYGTNDLMKLNLIKTGLSLTLINKLQTDNQINNITFDQNNNIIGNEEFEVYKNRLKGFYRFEIDKFL